MALTPASAWTAALDQDNPTMRVTVRYWLPSGGTSRYYTNGPLSSSINPQAYEASVSSITSINRRFDPVTRSMSVATLSLTVPLDPTWRDAISTEGIMGARFDVAIE